MQITKLAIWDLDGTIIDSFGVYRDVLKEAIALSHWNMPSDADIRRHFHGSLDDSIKEVLGATDGDVFNKLLNDFLTIQEKYYKNPEDHLHQDALQLARDFKDRGIHQIVVTNRNHEGRGSASPRYLVENSSMKALIDGIICGDEVEARKPDIGVLTGTTYMQQYTPDQILVIGDQFVDAKLAQNLSSPALLVNRSQESIPHLEELGTDTNFMTVVSSLDEYIR